MIIDSNTKSLEERVYLSLEEEILNGTLKSGDTLTENALSKRLGVSRTPIRAALHRLTEEGLVSFEANRGATVIDGTGWFSKSECKIVMVVCRKRDAASVLKVARRIDERAFITMGSVMGVYGQGFEALNKI